MLSTAFSALLLNPVKTDQEFFPFHRVTNRESSYFILEMFVKINEACFAKSKLLNFYN